MIVILEVISGTVSGHFWKRFWEQIDILYIMDENEIDSKKKPEILDMSEEVKQRISNYIQWNVVEESKIDPKIMAMFESFRCIKWDEIDIMWREFTKLKVLDLTNNAITVLENTPPNLQELYLNSNNIWEIRGPINSNLLHLGLAFNHIDEQLLYDITRFYPSLFSLNLSHNRLTNLTQTVEILQGLPSLKVLVMRGNPCCLTEGYKPYCMNKLGWLRVFDVTPITKDDSKKANKAKSERHTKATGEIMVSNDVSFDLEVSVLGGVEGTKLTEDHFEDPAVYEELEPGLRSSKFWVQIEFLGDLIKSDTKIWETEFMKEEEEGKTDFKLSLRKILRLAEPNPGQSPDDEKYPPIKFSESVFNTLMEGLWIELYEEYPLTESHETEEGETITRAVMREDKPAFKTAIRGVTKINTEQWLLNPNLNSTDLTKHEKNFFFKVKYKSIPEFWFENQVAKFKQSEKDAIDQYVKTKREKMAKLEEEEKQKAANEKVLTYLHFI